MTAAFFVFGLSMLVFAQLMSRAMASQLVRAAVTMAGVGTLGVAAFPLNVNSGGVEDVTHVVWAVVGYTGTVLAPIFGGWVFQQRSKPVAALTSVVVGVASLAALVGTSISAHPGLWQRAGLGIVDGWFMIMAIWIFRQSATSLTQGP